MKRGIHHWKAYAREMLSGNFRLPVLGVLLTAVLNFAASGMTSALFPGNTVLSIVLSQIFAFAMSLVLCVFFAGMSGMFLNISRDRPRSLGDLVYFFKNQPDRVLVASLPPALISLVSSIPLNYFSVAVSPGNTLEEYQEWFMTYLMLLLLSLALSVLFSMPFALTYYILADSRETGGMEAVRISLRMMRGNIGRYFLLRLSFVPWLLASVFTLYLALLWVVPYMEMSCVMFYRDLKGEFDPDHERAEATTAQDQSEA